MTSPPTFTLTVGSDTYIGAQPSTIVFGMPTTLNPGDSLMGSGTDTLSLSGSGIFHVDLLAAFSGFSGIVLNGSLASSQVLDLGTQPISVTEIGTTAYQVTLGSGAASIQGINDFDIVASFNSTAWNAGNAITSVYFLDLFGGSYDLTTNSFSNVTEVDVGGATKINSAVAAGISRFVAAGGHLSVADPTLDLSHTVIGAGLTVGSTNAAGTTFIVGDAGTAAQVLGGPGHDTIVADGLAFTAEQRSAIFVNSSIETLVDSSGVYYANGTSLQVTTKLANDTGISSTDNITSDPTVSGTGAPNAVVHFVVDGLPVAATTTADSNGIWTFVPSGLADGVHNIDASETDAAGNTAAQSVTFTLDTTPPTVTEKLLGGTQSDIFNTSITGAVAGTGIPNATVFFTVDGSSIAATATADATGAWSFVPPGLTAGVHHVVATEVDVAGNAASASIGFLYTPLLDIHVSWDSSVDNAPLAFKAAVSAAVQNFASYFADPVTINLHIGYGEVAGITMSPGAISASNEQLIPGKYSDFLSALTSQAASKDDQAAIATLPTTASNGLLTEAEAAALGMLPSGNAIDVYIGLGANPTHPFDYSATSNGSPVTAGAYDLFGAIAHEISETMGRQLLVGQTIDGVPIGYEPLDLFDYSAPGVRDFVGTQPGYFSIDGGQTNLWDFNTNSSGDFGDWATSVGNDSFSAFANFGVSNPVTANDLREMDILGWTLSDAGNLIAHPNPPVASGDAFVAEEGLAIAPTASNGVLFNDDGTSLMAMLVAGPSHGSLQLHGDGSFNYTPSTGFTGIDSFTYAATNSAGTSDAAALLYVVPVNTSGSATTLDLFSLSAEEQIAATYVAYFSRGADSSGFQFWVNLFNQFKPSLGSLSLFENIASSFGVSSEAQGLYPFLAHPQGASDAQVGSFLNSVYQNMFNRDGDAAGLAYWTGQIEQAIAAGRFVGDVLVSIIGGAQNTSDGQDITILMNKVAVGLEYVRQQEQLGTSWSFAQDGASSVALLHAVTADPQTVLTGIKQADLLIQADVH